MKTLVIAVHPDLREVAHTQRMVDRAAGSLDPDITIHSLYAEYPDEKIDVRYEQALLRDHDRIVFGVPHLLVQLAPAVEEVVRRSLFLRWAYGLGGHTLEGKEFGIAISAFTLDAAIPARRFGGGTPSRELTWPFEATVHRVGGIFLPPFVLTGVAHVTDAELAASGVSYLRYLTASYQDRIAA